MLSLALLVTTSITAGVAYGPDVKQRVDVIAPDRAGPHPVVVFLHGGVWQHGDRRDFAPLGRDLARHGFVAFIASYRLAPTHRWPAQRDDADAIVALALRDAAKYGGDPARLVVMGHSAGAQMAALVAARANTAGARAPKPAALALFSGVFDLQMPLDEAQDDGGFARFVAPAFGADRAALVAASPLRARARLDVPVLLVTSERDYAAMRAQTHAMHAHLRARGERVRLVELPAVDHFGMVAGVDAAMAAHLLALVPP